MKTLFQTKWRPLHGFSHTLQHSTGTKNGTIDKPVRSTDRS